jgi:hypothetical protein
VVSTRKYKPEPIAPLKLRGKEVAFTCSVKYLGVLLDPKLQWKQHLTERRKKFFFSMWVCRKAIVKTWCINSKVALRMYNTILLPKLLYALVIWWHMVSRVEAKNLLQYREKSHQKILGSGAAGQVRRLH